VSYAITWGWYIARTGTEQLSKRYFQDRVLWSPLGLIRAVVRAGLTIAWPFPWAIDGGSPSVRWERSLTISARIEPLGVGLA
jgi:hypothetical protein